MKKILGIVGLAFVGAVVALGVGLGAQAQMVGSAISGSGTASPGFVAHSSVVPPTIAQPVGVQPPIVSNPPIEPGFIQFNNLSVTSVSGAVPPAEILASNPNIYTMGSGAASAGSCLRYSNTNDASGTAIPCPNQVAPFIAQPYRIEVDANTRLMLRDRTAASLADFTAGDQINVFGYYNSDGSIQAYLIRNLSKPVENEFMQLNNVNLVSVSTGTTPATLVVTQGGGPCYGFGASGGGAKSMIACPLGISTSANGAANPALQNVAVPPSLAPTWQMLRKYVVAVDAQTVILDSNRTQLSLSDLQPGDSLNIYGNTTDNGATIEADIVRDVSIPASVSSFNGTVSQVNADGSFVLQTNDGRTITVQTPVQTGANVTVTGILDRLSNTLSQVSSIMAGSRIMAVPPAPEPLIPLTPQASGSVHD